MPWATRLCRFCCLQGPPQLLCKSATLRTGPGPLNHVCLAVWRVLMGVCRAAHPCAQSPRQQKLCCPCPRMSPRPCCMNAHRCAQVPGHSSMQPCCAPGPRQLLCETALLRTCPGPLVYVAFVVRKGPGSCCVKAHCCAQALGHSSMSLLLFARASAAVV